MPHESMYAELAHDELEAIQELEQALSHVKGRYISLVAFDLGDRADGADDGDDELGIDISATPAP